MACTLGRLVNKGLHSAMLAFRSGFGSDEHSVNPLLAQALFTTNAFVYHSHSKGTHIIDELLREFGLYVIVTTRNLPDLLMSVKDKMDNGIRPPCVPSPPKWKYFTEEQKWAWLAHNVGAWNFQFAASWMMAESETFWVKYEKYYADQVAGMEKILEYLCLPKRSRKEISEAAKETVNLKFGIVGRGQEAITQQGKDIIEEQLGLWGELEPFLRQVYE